MLTFKHRALAMVAGGLSTFGAAYLLFGGMPSAETINSKTIISGIVLVIGIAACHQLVAAAKRSAWAQVAAMTVIAFAATVLVVIGTAGRNAETIKASSETAERSQAAYARAVKDLTAARSFRDAAETQRLDAIKKADADVARQKDAVETACKNGEGRLCRGARATLATFEAAAARVKADQTVLRLADDAVKQRERDVKDLTPAPDTSPAKAFAVLLGTLGVVASVDKAEIVINALLPYVTSLVIEFAAAAFLLVAFPPAKVEILEPVRTVRQEPAPVALKAEPVPVALPMFQQAALAATFAVPAMFASTPAPAIVAPQQIEDVATKWSDGACHLLVTLADAGEEMTVTEAAEAMGVSVGEASRRKDELGAKLAIRRDGRNVFMSIA